VCVSLALKDCYTQETVAFERWGTHKLLELCLYAYTWYIFEYLYIIYDEDICVRVYMYTHTYMHTFGCAGPMSEQTEYANLDMRRLHTYIHTYVDRYMYA
jgi:hypothetical protein